MSTLQINLLDGINKRRLWVTLRDNLPVQDLIQKLVTDLELPQGEYELSEEESGKKIPLDWTLKKQGVQDKSNLRLQKKRKTPTVIPVPINPGGKISAESPPEGKSQDKKGKKPDKSRSAPPKAGKPAKEKSPDETGKPHRGKYPQEQYRPPADHGHQPGKSGSTSNFWHRPFPQPLILKWIPVSLWFYVRPIILIFILLTMFLCYFFGLCVCRNRSNAVSGLTFSSRASAIGSPTATPDQADQNNIPTPGSDCDNCSKGEISSATSVSVELESSKTETPSFTPLTKSEVDEIVKDLPESPEPYHGTCYVAFNTEKSPFDDVNVRRAFTYAVNRAYLTEYAVCDCGFTAREAAVTLYPKKAYMDNFAMNSNRVSADTTLKVKPGGDVYDKWADSLSSSGYEPSKMQITIATSEGYAPILETTSKEWVANLGVKINTTVVDFDSFTELITNNIAPQAFLACNYTDLASPFDFLYAFISGYYGNYIHWDVPNDYYQLVYQAYQNDDPALYLEAERMLVEDYAVIMPIYHYIYQ